MNLYGQRWLNSGNAQAKVNGHVIEIERHTAKTLRNMNAEFSMQLEIGRFHEMPKKEGPIAIVAGGPSLKASLQEVKHLDCPIMAAGSAHQYLRENGIPLYYAAIYDPLPVQALYFKNPHLGCTYIVASTCDPSVFDALDDYVVKLWHPAGEVDSEILGDEAKFIVGGGSTVTLRAIPLAAILGFSDIHLYGFDSSFEADQHAYNLNKGDPGLGEDIEVSVNGRKFTTTLQLLAQAQQFMQMKDRFPGMFRCSVHGDGMVAEMMRF